MLTRGRVYKNTRSVDRIEGGGEVIFQERGQCGGDYGNLMQARGHLMYVPKSAVHSDQSEVD